MFRINSIAYSKQEASVVLNNLFGKWLNFRFGPEQSCANKSCKKRQLRFIMQHTVSIVSILNTAYRLDQNFTHRKTLAQPVCFRLDDGQRFPLEKEFSHSDNYLDIMYPDGQPMVDRVLYDLIHECRNASAFEIEDKESFR
jgi:hypothetical protein